MKLLNFRALHIALAVIAVAALSSCSSKDPVEMVPDDVDFVVSCNLQKVLDQTGVKIADDDIELPGELSMYESTIPDEVKDIVCRCNKAVDASQTLWFGYIKAKESDPVDLYAVVKISDEDELCRILEDEANLDVEEEDGFKIFTQSNEKHGALLIKDDFLWLAASASIKDSSDAVKKVNKIIEKAKEKNISEVAGVAQNLNSDMVFSANVNIDKIIKIADLSRYMTSEQAVMFAAAADKLKGSWFNLSADLSGKSVTLKFKYYKPSTGNAVDYGVTAPINTDFLKYIPSDFMGIAAVNIKPEMIDQFCDMITSYINDEYQSHMRNTSYSMTVMSDVVDEYNASEYGYGYGYAYAQRLEAEHQAQLRIIDYLRNINGNIAVAISANDLAELCFGEKMNEFKFIATAELKSGTAENLKNELAALMNASADSTYSAYSDEVMIPVDRDFSLYLKADGNYLILSNVHVSAGNSNNFASTISGAEAVASVKLPSFAALTNGKCNFGANAEMRYSKGEVKYTFELTKCDSNLIEALINLCKGIDQAYSAYRRSHRSYDYGYNYYDDYDNYNYYDATPAEEAVEVPAAEEWAY